MKKSFNLCVATLLWTMFFGVFGCNDYNPRQPTLMSTGTPAEVDHGIVFRSGVRVYPHPETEINATLLAQRDGYATVFTDPYGYLWTMSTARTLTDQDFAEAGTFQTSKTDHDARFYYTKVLNWEVGAKCVVYLSAGGDQFVTIHRLQDQGACPTSAGYAEWLPQAEIAFTTETSPLWAYGANNSPENIEHGSFNNVPVYANDPHGHICSDFHLFGECLAYAGITLTGAKWESSEFINRYLRTAHNHHTLWTGPAKYLYDEGRNYGLQRMSNCGSVRPLVGDILVSKGGPTGHAAIVRNVSDHSVTIIQQNWFESSRDSHSTLGLRTSGNNYCVSDFGEGYPVSGWLRK